MLPEQPNSLRDSRNTSSPHGWDTPRGLLALLAGDRRGLQAGQLKSDAESDANLHEKVVVEQFKLLQPMFSTNLRQALISELVGSLVEG